MDDQQHSSSGNRPRLRGNHAASSNSSCSRTSPPSNQRHQRDFLPEQLEVNGMNDAGSSDNSMSELSATVQGSHNRKRSGVMSLEDIDDTGQQNSLETDNGDEMNFDYSEDGANGLAACSADVQQNEGLNHSNGHNPFELCSESKEPCVDEDSEMLLCDEVVSNRDAAVRGRHDQFHADHYAMYFDDVNDAEDGFGNDGLALETEVTDDEDGTGAANRSIDLVKRPMEDEEDAVEEGVLCVLGIDDKQRVLPVTTAGVSSGAAYLSESSAAVSCGRGKNVKNESAYAPPPMVLPRDRTAVASSSVHQLQQQQAGRSGPYQYYLSSKAATIQSPGYYHGMNSGGSGSAGPLAQVAPGAGFRFSANNGSNFGFGSGFSPAGAAYHSFSGARRRYLPGEEGAGPSGVSGGGASGSAPIGGHEMPPLNVVSMARGAAVGSPNNPLHNWQATKQTLKDRFSFMFNNEILADVHFIVGRGDQRQRIPAHKFVLAVGSAVFDAMFNGAMAASEQNDIDLPDVEPQAFLALLKFLYSDDVQIGPESVMTTLYTAKKYAVPALENACVDFLKRNLSPDNAFMLLTQARLFDEPQLAALCLEMIDKHSQEAINAEGFTDIDLDTLCAVLERDTLRIREVCLYAAVVRWSTEECHRQQLPVTPENQRQVLGRALQLIRFPLMSVEEFAQSAAQSGILSDREVVNLFLYFTVNPKPQVGFLDVPRCCVTGKEQVVNRFQRIEGRWGYSGTPDRIKFTVDRRIFVVGFGLFGSIHGPTEYSVNIQIIHCGSGKIIGSNDTTFQCDGSLSTFRVMFKEPVEIGPCITYIASATLKGPDSHYGTKGLRRIVHQSPGSGCVTFQFTYAAGNNNGTSVEDGQIPEIIFYTKLSS